jgi:hypothetical protein
MTASSVTVDCMEEERAQAGRYTCTLDVHYRYTRVWSLIGFRLGLHTSPLMTLDTYVSIPYIVLPGLESK